MKIVDDNPSALTALDRAELVYRPIGPRPNLRRLTEGCEAICQRRHAAAHAHVAYVRSPHAHARIVSIETAAAKQSAA